MNDEQDMNNEGTSMQGRMDDLVMRCREIIKCDTARISWSAGKMFLVIGFNCNTKEDTTVQWIKDGKPHDFDYVEEQTIASGNTEEELIESVREYKKICEITMEEYLKKVIDDQPYSRELVHMMTYLMDLFYAEQK